LILAEGEPRAVPAHATVWAYLAFVLDVRSRTTIGWPVAANAMAEALNGTFKAELIGRHGLNSSQNSHITAAIRLRSDLS
jgi:hypothetical protein